MLAELTIRAIIRIGVKVAAHITHKRYDKYIQYFSRNQGSKSSLPRPRRVWKDSIQIEHVTDSHCCNHQKREANKSSFVEYAKMHMHFFNTRLQCATGLNV
jgi:hypothetical protein